jgi:predicted nucleic acid-binding Zn ribbon protein
VPDQGSEDRVTLARAALAAARADARARGVRPAASAARATSAAPAVQTTASQAAVRDDADPGDAAAPDAAGRAQVREADPAQPSDQGMKDGPVPGTSGPGTTPAVGRRARRPDNRPGFPRQPQRGEPQPLGTAINKLLAAEGWGLAAATGSVFGRWAQIVGSDLAAHTTPESLSDGELTVAADSTAWATQVRLLAAHLVRRLNTELGDGTVRRVRVRGPVTGTRRPGEWRVRGSRGPRDTYG